MALAELDAPKLARRPNQNNPAGSVDEPWAWESREFLRKLLVGKNVLATVQHQISSGREFGHVLIGSTDPEKAENVAVKLVAEGKTFLLKVLLFYAISRIFCYIIQK